MCSHKSLILLYKALVNDSSTSIKAICYSLQPLYIRSLTRKWYHINKSFFSLFLYLEEQMFSKNYLI